MGASFFVPFTFKGDTTLTRRASLRKNAFLGYAIIYNLSIKCIPAVVNTCHHFHFFSVILLEFYRKHGYSFEILVEFK